MDCIFCKIIKGNIPSYKIYEDDEFLAFLDIFPKTEGHTLVIPKQHLEWVWDYPQIGKYFEAVGKIARHLRTVSGEKVIRSIVYGIDVPHAHVHLLPGKKDLYGGNQLESKKLAGLVRKYRFTTSS